MGVKPYALTQPLPSTRTVLVYRSGEELAGPVHPGLLSVAVPRCEVSAVTWQFTTSLFLDGPRHVDLRPPVLVEQGEGWVRVDVPLPWDEPWALERDLPDGRVMIGENSANAQPLDSPCRPGGSFVSGGLFGWETKTRYVLEERRSGVLDVVTAAGRDFVLNPDVGT